MGFFRTLISASPMIYVVLGLCGAVTVGAVIWHHDHALLVNEDNKIQVSTDKILLKVEDEKSKIRSIPLSDARTIARLRHGTYFNH